MKNFVPASLKWFRSEIDLELKPMGNTIQNYIENGDINDDLKVLQKQLIDLSGVFHMIGAFSAYFLITEIYKTFDALISNKISTEREKASDLLAQSWLQFPFLLDYLESGSPDSAEFVLPTINAMRHLRGERKLRPIEVFFVNLNTPFNKNNLNNLELITFDKVLFSLKQWLNKDPAANLLDLSKGLKSLASQHKNSRCQWTFWILGCICQASYEKKFDLHVNIRFLFSQLDKSLSLINNIEEYKPENEILRNALFFFAYEGYENKDNIKDLNNILENFEIYLPTVEEKQKAKSILAGKNAQIITVVLTTIKEQLTGVKDGLDLFLRTNERRHLDQQVDVLNQLEQTFVLVDLENAKSMIEKQKNNLIDILKDYDKGVLRQESLRSNLLEIAEELLFVEDSCNKYILTFSPKQNLIDDEALQVVIKEISTQFSKIRHEVDSSRNLNPHDALPKITLSSNYFNEIEGALCIVSMFELIPYVSAMNKFLKEELSKGPASCQTSKIQAWADTLIALEYYIEAKNDYLPILDKILNFAKKSVKVFYPEFEIELKPVETELVIPPAMPVQEPVPAPVAVKPAMPVQEPVPAPVAVKPVMPVQEPVPAPAPIAVKSEKPKLELSLEEKTDSIAANVTTPLVEKKEFEVKLELSLLDNNLDLELEKETNYTSCDSKVNDVELNLELTDISVNNEDDFSISDLNLDFNDSLANNKPLVVFDQAAAVDTGDMTEIFSEELTEEINGLNEWLPLLNENLNNKDLIYNIRKSFHTIKGSGRMVGASNLGEMSWKIEATLNQVVDGKRTITPIVFNMIERGKEMFEKHFDALMGKETYWDYETFLSWVEKIEAGNEVPYPIINKVEHKIDSNKKTINIKSNVLNTEEFNDIKSNLSNYLNLENNFSENNLNNEELNLNIKESPVSLEINNDIKPLELKIDIIENISEGNNSDNDLFNKKESNEINILDIYSPEFELPKETALDFKIDEINFNQDINVKNNELSLGVLLEQEKEIKTNIIETEKQILIKEVPVEVIKEVRVEVPVEVIKEVRVEVPIEVIKEVRVEVPVEVIKEVSDKSTEPLYGLPQPLEQYAPVNNLEDIKNHLNFAYQIQEKMALVSHIINRKGDISNFDRDKICNLLNSISMRQLEVLSYIEDISSIQEEKVQILNKEKDILNDENKTLVEMLSSNSQLKDPPSLPKQESVKQDYAPNFTMVTPPNNNHNKQKSPLPSAPSVDVPDYVDKQPVKRSLKSQTYTETATESYDKTQFLNTQTYDQKSVPKKKVSWWKRIFGKK